MDPGELAPVVFFRVWRVSSIQGWQTRNRVFRKKPGFFPPELLTKYYGDNYNRSHSWRLIPA